MKTPHPNAEFIAEAIKDTSRKIEGQNRNGEFESSNLIYVISCTEPRIFRFADTVVKPVIISSLSDNELMQLFLKESGVLPPLRLIADTAAERTIEELPALRCSLNGSKLHSMYLKFDNDLDYSFDYIAEVVIHDYIEQVKEGKR